MLSTTPRKLKLRVITAVAVASVAALGLVGCSSGSSQTTGSATKGHGHLVGMDAAAQLGQDLHCRVQQGLPGHQGHVQGAPDLRLGGRAASRTRLLHRSRRLQHRTGRLPQRVRRLRPRPDPGRQEGPRKRLEDEARPDRRERPQHEGGKTRRPLGRFDLRGPAVDQRRPLQEVQTSRRPRRSASG